MSEKNIMEGITLTTQAADKVKSALKLENKEGPYSKKGHYRGRRWWLGAWNWSLPNGRH